MTSEASPLRLREALAALGLLMALTLALHHRGFQGDLLVDDWINAGWPAGDQWRGILFGNWIEGGRPPASHALYRPIPRFSFLLDRALWGLDRPWGFHLTNLILHGLNVFFLWGTAWSLWRRRLLAWLAALVFLAHPLTVEAAQWVSARTDLWAAAFTFPALWLTLALASRERFRTARFWSLPLMALALMSKETNATLFALLLGIDLWRQGGWSRARAGWWAATLALGVWYFIQRHLMFGQFLGMDMAGRYGDVRAYVRACVEAVKLFVNPFMSWPWDPWYVPCFPAPRWLQMHVWSDLLWWVLGVLFAGGITAVIALIVHGRSRGPLLFACAWFSVAMAPLTALGFSLHVDTRLLYPAAAASTLIALGTVSGLTDWSGHLKVKWALRAAVAAWIIPLAAMTFHVTGHWAAASRVARAVVEAVSSDVASLPPAHTVFTGLPPERIGRAMMFRTVDLQVAVNTVNDDRGLAAPRVQLFGVFAKAPVTRYDFRSAADLSRTLEIRRLGPGTPSLDAAEVIARIPMP
ncbi:MAG: hypothetical protein HUU25_04885 [Candidatus Sumerlaeia bacterium]|nr:hypothetical protein [Candidatus Sumerlaeia bacterium]